MKKVYILLIVTLGLVILLGACTKLDEPLYDKLNAANFYKTPDEINAGVSNIYYRINNVHIWLNHWQLQECSTDHGMCPWGDGGVYKQVQTHTWDATHGPMRDVYTGNFAAIAAANTFLENLSLTNISNKADLEGEVKALRAWCYMELCDLFGNVPIVTVAKLDPAHLPTNATRLEVFNFIETELKDAISKLPSAKDIPNRQAVYPRIVVKEAAQAMLAKLYLNAEVWSGTARWQDCVTACDQIINSGAYSIPSGYGDIWKTFAPENDQTTNNQEIIFALSKDNVTYWDVALGFWANCLGVHGELKGAVRDGQDLGISQNFWGGPSVLDEHYQIYEDADFRKSLILNGKFYDKDGKLLIDIQPFSNTDVNGFTNPKEGLSCIKYRPDPQQTFFFGRNDMLLLRYADILLSKAEALYRLSSGNQAAAEALITQVYSRNFTNGKTFTIASLDDILMERSREFLWENSYRTDLVRFGKFISMRTKWHTTDDPAYRNIFPIPQSEIQSNPNLKQNPGY